MQKALCMLELPVLELSSFLQEELGCNPLIEFTHDTKDNIEYKGKTSQRSPSKTEDRWEDRIESPTSLFSHYMQQAHLTFSSKKDLWIAEQLLGSVSEKGLLEEIPEVLIEFFSATCINHVLHQIQVMDPPGLCAMSEQDSLLIQLRCLGKEDTVTYFLIKDFYPELIRQKFSFLEKKCGLKASEIKALIKKDLSLIDPFPGLRFRPAPTQAIEVDILIEEREGSWQIAINEKPLPSFTITDLYSKQQLSSEDKSYISRHLSSARWIQSSLIKRKKTLGKLAHFLLEKQKDFFEGKQATLLPLTLAEAAEALHLSESTVGRAVSGKYLSCPKGIYPLKYFFSSPSSQKIGAPSSSSAKELLESIIKAESKDRPLSDEALAKKMQRMGFYCARRTITKYRKSLKIAPASKRKLL
jgi:RNA polymerase sigma-54 factor